VAEPLDFLMRLIDQASGPAGKIASGFDKIDAALKKVNDAPFKGLDHLIAPKQVGGFAKLSQGIGNTFGAKAQGMFMGAAQGLADVDDALGKVGTSVGGVLTGVAVAAAAVAAVGVGLAVAGTKLAIGASDFRENAEIGLEAYVGSAEAAGKLYDRAIALADKVGLDKADALAKLKGLMSAGLGEESALSALTAIANVAAVKGEGGANAVANLIEKIQATGKFDEAAIKGLAKQGIATEDVYKQLEKQTGKTRKEVEALVKAGKITSAEGIAAITAGINEGKIGKLGEKLGNTFSRLWGDIGGQFTNLFDKVDTGPLKDILKNISEFLTGPGGEKVKESINKVFGAGFKIVGALFGDLSDPKQLDKFVGGVERFADAMVFAADAAIFLGGLASNVFQVIGAAISFTLDPITTLREGFAALPDSITGAVSAAASAVYGQAAAFLSAGMELGNSLIDGIVGALSAGIPLVGSIVAQMKGSGGSAGGGGDSMAMGADAGSASAWTAGAQAGAASVNNVSRTTTISAPITVNGAQSPGATGDAVATHLQRTQMEAT
jgi:tape measure domain-containing protein